MFQLIVDNFQNSLPIIVEVNYNRDGRHGNRGIQVVFLDQAATSHTPVANALHLSQVRFYKPYLSTS